MRNDQPIALFDSGVGGLTVLKAITEILPHENLIYLGDTARVPYGTRSRETIIRYTLMAASKLAQNGIKMLVVACNTATSVALPALRERFAPMPVLGVVRPGAQAAVQASKKKRIGVIATEATIRGKAYQKAIGELDPAAMVISRACTLLVSLAEEGWASGEVAELVARRYLADLFRGENDPDTLLLGCTHFPLFRETFKKITGPEVAIVDSAGATASAARLKLEESGLLRQDKLTTRRFLTTDNPERFASSGSLFLGAPLDPDSVELVDLQK